MGKGKTNEKSVMDKAAIPLFNAGFNILAIDLRNHGKSSDAKPITLGLYEGLDVLSAIEWLRINKNATKIGLWGESMGGASAIFGASYWNELVTAGLRPDILHAITSDCSFGSAKAAAVTWVADKLSLLSPSKLLPSPATVPVSQRDSPFVIRSVDFLWKFASLFGPLGLDIRPDDAIVHVPVAFFLVHGTSDPVVKVNQLEALTNALISQRCRDANQTVVPVHSADELAADDTVEMKTFLSYSGGQEGEHQKFCLATTPLHTVIDVIEGLQVYVHTLGHCKSYQVQGYLDELVKFYQNKVSNK
eukprot:TRINITY_DN1597_c0_g2_i1.p1 TRINITY_DN1597_c0_g2~~TRINITY_DN1597_c0_g2_i1.p1  ORF type:complete len:304 (+),score=84.46 TRINITY_DN1597_c0_g2_i1:635-1546(+)